MDDINQLLIDLHAELFDLVHQPYRIPCTCPPAQHKDGNPNGEAIPAFSCPFCRLERVVSELTKEPAHA